MIRTLNVAEPVDAADVPRTPMTEVPHPIGTVVYVPPDAADAVKPLDASKPPDASAKHVQTTATPTARPRPFVNGDVALSPDRE